jgi:hypothetical protein
MVTFLVIVITVWSVLHVYVFWRAASVPMIARHVPRWLLVVAAVLLWSSFLVGRIFDRPAAVTGALEWISAYWLGVLFLMFFCLLVVDVVTGFGFLWARWAPSVRGWALVAAGVLSAIALVQGLRAPVVRDYEVRLAGLPADADGLTIVVVSDMHLGTMIGEGWLSARAAQVEALRADLIVVLGDVVEGHGESDRARRLAPILRRFTAPLGTWAVLGNHESYAGGEPSARYLEEVGFHVLRDRWREARPGLVIAGVDDADERRPSPDDAGRVQRALAGRPADAATVFLSHRPRRADEAAAAGVGLMLAAHTHGGQIWPFSYVIGLTTPTLGGRVDVDGMPLIVCRGTGTWGPRMRLWRPGEILRITLRAPAAGKP